MRLVSALLFVGLTGSLAIADEAKPADPKPDSAAASRRRVPLRVVRMLPETQQVLLFDKNRGTHVVAEVGQDVEGYRVDEIADDEVTLIAGNGAEIILTAPDVTQVPGKAADRRTRAAAPEATKATSGSSEAPAMAPIDPYADADAAAPTAAPASSTGAAGPTAASPSTAAPIAAGEGGMRVTSAATAGAPSDPYPNLDPGIAAFVEAVGATPSPAATATTPAATMPAATTPTATTPAAATPTASAPMTATPATPVAPAKTDAKVDAATALAAAATGTPAPVAAVAPLARPGVTISRGDIDTALADFGATAVTFDAAFVAEGLRIDQIAKGTILAKLGLEKGDVLTAVDNQPLHSLDDAASLYARAGTAKAVTLHILRGGKPTTLKVTIR